MKKDNKVIVWSTDVIQLIEGKPIGGIAVQVFFWAQAFVKHGWQVFSFIENGEKTVEKENVCFKPKRNIKRINVFLEWWYAFKYMISIRPQLIIYRGANRELLPLSFVSKLLGIKLVFFAASDVNFEPGKELVGSEINRKMYQKSIKHINYFITQNDHQHDTLFANYRKESLILFNIWGITSFSGYESPIDSEVVWVANFRRLKRAEWVLDAAERLPQIHFVMAGSAANDESYYNRMKQRAESLDNVVFLGGQSFFYVNELVAKSKVLLCTSTFEGFPNTFLQAWSNGLPVISTVNPSNVISNNSLGIIIDCVDELTNVLKQLLDDKDYYSELCDSVNAYFVENHSSESGYNKLIEYLS